MIAAAGAAVSVMGASAYALPVTIFEDSFESPNVDNPGRPWRVFQTGVGDSGSWNAVSGAGIEIQNDNQGFGHVTAFDGDQYVELDSDPFNGGIPGVSTNSAMATSIDFIAGEQYQVSFAFRPRTTQFWESDGIRLYGVDYDAATSAVASRQQLFEIGRTTTTNVNDWVVYDVFFTAQPDFNGIAFEAFGIGETLGGFIDAVSVSQVPIPAALPLFGAGLAGLAWARGGRRRKEA